jgi:predicted HTH domain antitoxin
LKVEITVELPNDFAQRPDPAREAVEALAIAGYQSGKLTAFQASRLLGFGSRFEFDRFLKAHNIYDHAYGVGDLAADLETLRNLDEDSEQR